MERLDRGIQSLTIRMEQGHNTVTQLLDDHSQRIKDHISSKVEWHTRVIEEPDAHGTLLKTLFFPEIVARQEQIPEAFKGTCGWVFDPPTKEDTILRPWSSFNAWLETGDGVYWVSGKPGAGKSTLMKYIVNDDRTSQLLSAWEKGTELIVASFFFWNAGSTFQKSYAGLLRSLLYQIAIQWPELIHLIESKSAQSTATRVAAQSYLQVVWTEHRLTSLLRHFIEQKPPHISICLFIDGLDEIEGDEDTLLDLIRVLSRSSRCKVCVSSRPEQTLRHEFRLNPQLRVQDLNREDIRRTIEEKLIPTLTTNNNFRGDDHKIEVLVDGLTNKASGVFLWLDLMVKDLIRGSKNGDEFEELLIRLEKTPNTINGMYTSILQRLDPLYRVEAFQYFRILIAAQGMDMSISLLMLVLAEEGPWGHISNQKLEYFDSPQFELLCQALKARLISRCGSFVDIREHCEYKEFGDAPAVLRHDQSVDFTHRTALDYIREEERRESAGHINWLPEYRLLARSNIAKLALLPLKYAHIGWADDRNASNEMGYLLSYSMSAVSALGCRSAAAQDNDTTQWLQIKFVEQVFQLMHSSDLSRLIPLVARDPVSIRRLTSKLPILIDLSKSVNYSGLSDLLDFAALFNCSQYVQLEVSKHEFSQERVSELLLYAVYMEYAFGLLAKRRNDFDYFPRILTIKAIIQQSFNPNEKILVTPLDHTFIINSTIWGRVFACLVDSYPLELLAISQQDNRAKCEACCLDIITRSLSLGANPNTGLAVRYHLRGSFPRHTMFYLDCSPLGLLEGLRPDIMGLLPAIETLLRSAGGVSRHIYRFLKVENCFYRVSEIQSQELRKSLAPVLKAFSSYFGQTFWRKNVAAAPDEERLLDVIASITYGDSIDEEQVMRSIRECPDSFE